MLLRQQEPSCVTPSTHSQTALLAVVPVVAGAADRINRDEELRAGLASTQRTGEFEVFCWRKRLR